jgi:protocatechuate 3,4-dioxygenase beta subunit
MKRDDFLKGVGILGAGILLPAAKTFADNSSSALKSGAVCTLIPSETEGPFPLDLTTNNAATYFRTDIRESKPGVQLNVKLKVYGTDNCQPMTNVRVNIWHCDKDGMYSGYYNAQNTGSTAATANETWLRGYQMTDAYGEVNFVTIFPGWYSGRVCHIHFQAYVSSVYKAVSQFTFPEAAKNALYAANSSLYTKGADPLPPSADNIFSDGYSLQTATLTANSDGSYSAYFEFAISGSGAGSTGLIAYEGETGGHFKLGQNFPNPHTGFTTIPFTLNAAAEVEIAIYDLQARKVASIQKGHLAAGDYKIPIDFSALGIPSGSYLYQLQVSNSAGDFRQVKMMTEAR